MLEFKGQLFPDYEVLLNVFKGFISGFSIKVNYGDFLAGTKMSMAVQFKKNSVIQDPEDGVHVQYQSISYEHSWKSLEEYVVNVLKQSAGLLFKKRYTARLWETRNWVPNPFVNMYKLSLFNINLFPMSIPGNP